MTPVSDQAFMEVVMRWYARPGWQSIEACYTRASLELTREYPEVVARDGIIPPFWRVRLALRDRLRRADLVRGRDCESTAPCLPEPRRPGRESFNTRSA